MIKRGSHGLIPFMVEGTANYFGLLDPLHIERSPGHVRCRVLRTVYAQVIAGDTADWFGITQAKARQRIDAYSDTLEVIRGALYHAPDVLPDPVLMTAAIGITLTCWRHTEIEG